MPTAENARILVVEQHAQGRDPHAPACGLIGSQVAINVVHYLSGICDPATLGASLTVDLRTMAIRREEVESVPDCEVCGLSMPSTSAANRRGHGHTPVR
jgi:hypothetical protein